MKKLILLAAICLPNILNAQNLKNSRAYLGALFQDNHLGGSLILSYGLSPYLGIGAGVDVISYDVNSYAGSTSKASSLFVPFYADLRFKIPTSVVEPFVCGQFGEPAFSQTLGRFTDITGQPATELKQNGKYFYGIGAGISTVKKKVGVFAAITYRMYAFKYSPDLDINGRAVPKPDDQGQVLITAGLVF